MASSVTRERTSDVNTYPNTRHPDRGQHTDKGKGQKRLFNMRCIRPSKAFIVTLVIFGCLYLLYRLKVHNEVSTIAEERNRIPFTYTPDRVRIVPSQNGKRNDLNLHVAKEKVISPSENEKRNDLNLHVAKVKVISPSQNGNDLNLHVAKQKVISVPEVNEPDEELTPQKSKNDVSVSKFVDQGRLQKPVVPTMIYDVTTQKNNATSENLNIIAKINGAIKERYTAKSTKSDVTTRVQKIATSPERTQAKPASSVKQATVKSNVAKETPVEMPQSSLSNHALSVFLEMSRHGGMTSSEKTSSLHLLDQFIEVVTSLQLPWFIYGGSLLGSWRHHGIIPWDDVISVIISLNDKKRLLKEFKAFTIKTGRKYMFYDGVVRLKFWSSESKNLTNKPWAWPYLNIRIYDKNSSHLWDIASESKTVTHKLSSVFPLTYRPFEGMMIPSPNDTLSFLREIFGDAEFCSSSVYSHKWGRRLPSLNVQCKSLANSTAFVHRSKSPDGGVEEKLVLGDKWLQYWTDRVATDNALTEPYSLKLATVSKDKQYFSELMKHGMTADEKAIALQLLDKFAEVMTSLQLPWHLYSGALLGSWRHHGMIPWDDDIDVMLNVNNKGALLRTLQMLMKTSNGKFNVYDSIVRLKFWMDKSQRLTTQPWKWPYLDILLYDSNSTHLWAINPEFQHKKFKKSSVFPLENRPFEGRLLPAPYDSYDFLRTDYGNATYCETWRYSHKLETGAQQKQVPCKSLADVVPFVHRSVSQQGGVAEKLALGNKVLSTWWARHMPQYGIHDPYTLKLMNTTKSIS